MNPISSSQFEERTDTLCASIPFFSGKREDFANLMGPVNRMPSTGWKCYNWLVFCLFRVAAMDENSFGAFIQQVRAGDEQAATELVRLYEPEIRREGRLRLRYSRLRRD